MACVTRSRKNETKRTELEKTMRVDKQEMRASHMSLLGDPQKMMVFLLASL